MPAAHLPTDLATAVLPAGSTDATEAASPGMAKGMPHERRTMAACKATTCLTIRRHESAAASQCTGSSNVDGDTTSTSANTTNTTTTSANPSFSAAAVL